MNIVDYVSYYGVHTFDNKPFNEIDNLIFSMLLYVDYRDIFKKDITIGSAGELFLENHSDKKYVLISINEGIEVLKAVYKSNRFKDIVMSNYYYEASDESQFSAVTFKIDKRTYYVAFEGTDSLLSGWEEDCKMAYKFPVKAHTKAINYLNKNFTLKPCDLILGGHSKGGNLALVSSMYANPLIKRKIKFIYNNDGQGLRKTQFESREYESIKNKYIHIIPHYSIIGLLLKHDDNYVVVKTSRKGFYGHTGLSWQVSYDHFEKEHLSRFSKVFDDGFSRWLDKYNDKQREMFVKEVFKLFYENNIKSLEEVKINKELIVTLFNTSKTLDESVKEMAKELIKVIGKTNLEYPLI